MNKKEFKELDNQFLTKLKFELDKMNADFKILPSNPFEKSINIGIFFKDSPNFYEVYSFSNNGEVAEYRFLGHTQGE